jgi:Rieske Fe-S protein
MSKTRRELLLIAGTTAGTGLSGCAYFLSASHPHYRPADNRPTDGFLRIQTSELKALGAEKGAVQIKTGSEYPDLLIAWFGGYHRWIAVTSDCTHQGCVVDWDPQRGQWECPCHGSRYGVQGVVIEGPAVKALIEAPVEVQGDMLVIDIRHLEGKG